MYIAENGPKTNRNFIPDLVLDKEATQNISPPEHIAG